MKNNYTKKQNKGDNMKARIRVKVYLTPKEGNSNFGTINYWNHK